MNDNIMAGANIHAGGGYSEGTKEGYEAFAKKRRESIIRERFEEVCYPNFGVTSGHSLRRNPTGEYVSDALEDHWQTFQEGWEEAVKAIIKDIELYETDSRNHISYLIRQKYLES